MGRLTHSIPYLLKSINILRYSSSCSIAEILNSTAFVGHKDALIIAIYKKKIDRSDCGNYRGISLLSTAGGDNSGKNLSEKTTEHCRGDPPRKPIWISSFTLYNRHDIHRTTTTEKAVEQQQSLYIVFIDPSNAFDTVDRSTLWTFTKEIWMSRDFCQDNSRIPRWYDWSSVYR